MVRSSDTIVTDAGDVSHLRYQVVSDLPVAAGTEFDAQQLKAMSEPVPAAIRPYTQLTRTPEIDQIQQRAEQIVGDAQATNPYTKAKALRDYFRGSGFVYDTSVDSFDSGSAILQFLHDKRGFCVQFASAYAVMARTLGIPARVAVGFTPGALGREGHVPRDEPRRARVARDLPERCGLDAHVRPHAVTTGRGARAGWQ